MTRLAMLRHGPTDWSAARRFQGRRDLSLSAEGRARVADWRLPPDASGWRWLVSPLARARETAALLGLDATVEPLLVEQDFGAYEGRTAAEIAAEEGAAFAANEARGLDFTPPGGESPRRVQDRLMPLLRRLAVGEAAVGAVCHRGVLRAVYALATGWDMRGRPPDKLRDGCLHGFDLSPEGRPAVAFLNQPLGPP